MKASLFILSKSPVVFENGDILMKNAIKWSSTLFYGVSLEVCRFDLLYPNDHAAFNKKNKKKMAALLEQNQSLMFVHWYSVCLLPVDVNTQKHPGRSEKWICLPGSCSPDLRGFTGICVWM